MSLDFHFGAVAICSRGLVHSRTVEAVERMIGPRRRQLWYVEFTHDSPIPEAQNEIARKIFNYSLLNEYLLFIEEDIVPPVDLLERFEHNPHVVQCVDYALPGGIRSVSRRNDGSVIFSGLGCMLVPRGVFEAMGTPWFACDYEFTIENGRLVKARGGLPANVNYGRQDIYFSWKLQQLGVPIHCLEGIEAQHLRVKERGGEHQNDGCHLIEALK